MLFEEMMKMKLMEIGVMILEMALKKSNTVDRIMMLIAVLVLILVHVYVVVDISSFLSYVIFSLRVGMILAFPTRFNDPIEIPTANIDTVVPNGIILENYYVLSLF